MNKEELIEKINNWVENAGESFTDYFMHDNVKDTSWAFWLLGKGYTEHANKIINEILAGETCIDQEILYEIFPEYVGGETISWSRDNYDKNLVLWAEFLVATPYYLNKVTEFLTEKQ